VVEARSPKCYEDVLWSLLSGGTSRCAGVTSGQLRVSLRRAKVFLLGPWLALCERFVVKA
jgi:hypothetical protein